MSKSITNMTSLHKKLPVNGHKEATVYVILKGNIKILANDENLYFISKEQFTINGSMNLRTTRSYTAAP